MQYRGVYINKYNTIIFLVIQNDTKRDICNRLVLMLCLLSFYKIDDYELFFFVIINFLVFAETISTLGYEA